MSSPRESADSAIKTQEICSTVFGRQNGYQRRIIFTISEPYSTLNLIEYIFVYF